jgi:hypothetical protein
LKQTFLILTALLLFTSCAYTSKRARFHTFNTQNEASAEFEKSVSDFGAYYIATLQSIEYNQIANVNLTATVVEHQRLKILNKAGYQYARLIIPDIELKKFKATITKADGSTKTLQLKDLTKVTAPASLPVINHDHYLVYSVPGVEENMIIDYSFEFTEKMSFFERMYISTDLPIHDARYELTMITHFKHKVKTYNDLKRPTITHFGEDKERKTLYSWHFDNLLPLKKESFSPSPKRYTPYFIGVVNKVKTSEVEVSIVNKWRDLSRFISVKDKNDSWFSNKYKDELERIKKANNKNTVSALEIYNFVQKNYKLDNTVDQGWDPDKVIKIRKGAWTGLNRTLFILLKEAGFAPSYALLKSYNTGDFDYSSPSIFEFDLVVPMVENTPLLPFSHYPMGELPAAYQDILALDFQEKSERSFRTAKTDLEKNVYKLQVDLTLNDLLDEKINLIETHTGQEAYRQKSPERYYLEHTTESDKKKYKEVHQNYLNGRFADMAFFSVKNEHVEDVHLPLIQTYSVGNKKVLTNLGDEYLIQLGSLVPKMYTDLISKEERIHDFDFNYPNLDQIDISFKIPEGYKVNFESVHFEPIDNHYLYQKISIDQKDGKLTIHYLGGTKVRSMPAGEAITMRQFAENIAKLRTTKFLIAK